MKKQAKESTYPYPSRFGSHTSMVVEDTGGEYVVCEDEYGRYTTHRTRLDSALADPNRCAESRLGALFKRSQKENK